MSRLKAIFTNWPYILEIYRQCVSHPGAEAMTDTVLLIMREIGVGFGDRLSEYRKTGFLDIGCGLAIPSLTLAGLGCPDVLAIEIDPKSVSKKETIKEEVGGDWKDFNE